MQAPPLPGKAAARFILKSPAGGNQVRPLEELIHV